MAKGKEIFTDGHLAILLVAVILIIDQIIKIEVKTSMALGEAIHVTNWFYIDFVENNGMAYGMTFINKLVLSILRLVAIAFITRYIWKVVKQSMRTRYIVFLSMILAGAIGNDRFDVLRTNFQCLHAFYRVIVCAIWYRLCRLPNWQGGRHVLLSAYRYHLSRVVSIQRR